MAIVLKNLWKGERGASLLEMIIVIILLGVALPAFLSIISGAARRSMQNDMLGQAVTLAEQKMEEIIAFKEANWDWYKNPSALNEVETLADGYKRTVTVTEVNNWGSINATAWEVTVKVEHSALPNGYKLVTRLTKYH